MASEKELADFLKKIEAKAFKRTVYSTRDEEAALDIVQDSMIKLAEKYGQNDPGEWPMLFTRILQNTTLDWFRRQKTKNTWISLFSSFKSNKGDDFDSKDDSDTLDFIDNQDESQNLDTGERHLERKELAKILENELSKLPARQREAFLMRYWDELDISETAQLMGCSEGSVKTHCSRAAASLSKALKKQGFTS